MPDLAVIGLFVAALRAHHPGARIELASRADGIARDIALLEETFAKPDAPALLRIWDNPRCVVVSRRLAQRPGFDAARWQSASAGWPVVVRPSGGTAVVHRPGILNISLAFSESRTRPGMSAAYDRLAALTCGALRRLGVDADMGAVPGSFCDGHHNIRWRGRKIAGTAGLTKRRGGITARLVHASLCMTGDLREDLTAIKRVEKLCGIDAHYTHQAHVTLEEAFGAGQTA